MQIIATKPPDYEELCDLLDAYYEAVRAYNKSLGAFDMSAAELQDARRREALNYSRVQKLKRALGERGIAL